MVANNCCLHTQAPPSHTAAADTSAALVTEGGLAGELLRDLPFALTPCQRAALEEIGVDMGSGARMVRLLQVRIVYKFIAYEA